MVVDRGELSANLNGFYDFKGKAILYAGAGRGQLLDPNSRPRRVAAIDSDPPSLEGFRKDAKTRWTGIPIRFIPRKFETVTLKGDVVYFEFCLYQMENPLWALEHARTLARDIIVMDHLPGSRWIYYWEGEEKVAKSTRAIKSFGVKRSKKFVAEQRFPGYDAFATRLTEGAEAPPRVLELKGERDIVIPMDYGLFQL